ncbi:hypothetical protein POM88_009671 [Heracleum sosnowskyi]|uniref:non-specific serine/threonine protein kinase n=1 Tax=Heracleum sosnowskyi TaxID=360622 RepID=A0AAD8JB08_9APIA|nr:hypothetical protein POM88_009671 [Heracleum sosnowskyi]
MYRWIFDRDALLVNVAIKKVPDYRVIVEMSCIKSPEDFLIVKWAYQICYKHSMEEDVVAHTSGDMRKAFGIFQVHLVDWLKQMVANRNSEGVLDPKLQDKPSLRSLRRAILVALCCVDPNTQKRPKMEHVVHMLEAEDSYNVCLFFYSEGKSLSSYFFCKLRQKRILEVQCESIHLNESKLINTYITVNGHWYLADDGSSPGDLLLLSGRPLSHATAGLRPVSSYRAATANTLITNVCW